MIKTERKLRFIYADQLLCLLALLVMAVIMSGSRSIGLALIAVIVSVIVDMLCCRLSKKIYNPRDLSTITSGLCLALMSPANLSYSFIIFGCALAIGVKHIFGGKNNYIFNPTAVAFAFLIICYPTKMLLYPGVGELQPLFGEPEFIATVNVGMENLLLRGIGFPVMTSIDFLIGSFAGPVGTTHVLIIIVCSVCLLFRRSISGVVTISCLSIIIIFRLLFPIHEDVIGALMRELFGGYLLFALIFLANDPQTVPKTVFGKLYYGVLLGVFTIVFKGKVEGWFIFAVLAANTFSYRMDLTAERISDNAVKLAESLQKKLTAYERFSEDARAGKFSGVDLTSTMEIDIIDPSNYDMPPIDNKVIKIKKKKRNVLTYAHEFAQSVKDKVKPDKNTEKKDKIHEFKDSFIFSAYRALYESILKIVDVFFKHKEQADASLSLEDVMDEKNSEYSEAASTGDFDISDFEEIASDIAKIEALIEEQNIEADLVSAPEEEDEDTIL